MIICEQCGTSSEGAKFCPECGAALRVAERPVAEERKVVTALFCDLVGFTSLSETADPEDVNTMLDAYAAVARSQIENHGGIVQKFIGDAVVGVFGVPAAHEDEHMLIATAAAIAEAMGDLPGAAEGYADAAVRWERFGVVPEHAFALLGHGRCLVSLGRPGEAAPALRQTRGLFHALGATPGIAETDGLLETATALSS